MILELYNFKINSCIPNYIIESYNNEMKKVEQEVIKYLKNKNLEDKLKKLNKLVIYLHIPIL